VPAFRCWPEWQQFLQVEYSDICGPPAICTLYGVAKMDSWEEMVRNGFDILVLCQKKEKCQRLPDVGDWDAPGQKEGHFFSADYHIGGEGAIQIDVLEDGHLLIDVGDRLEFFSNSIKQQKKLKCQHAVTATRCIEHDEEKRKLREGDKSCLYSTLWGIERGVEQDLVALRNKLGATSDEVDQGFKAAKAQQAKQEEQQEEEEDEEEEEEEDEEEQAPQQKRQKTAQATSSLV
jgi:hypothetical protein